MSRNSDPSHSNEESRFHQILSVQISRYPKMKIEDLYKLTYQGAMGSEHAISSVDAARAWLEREVEELSPGPEEPIVDPISPNGNIVRSDSSIVRTNRVIVRTDSSIVRPDSLIIRVNLRPYISSGADLSSLLDAFIETANEYNGSEQKLSTYWNYLERMAEEGELPFQRRYLQTFFERMREERFPSIHHSSTYNEAYSPAYRVIMSSAGSSDIP